MDLGTIRMLNLAGSIIFGIFGILTPLLYLGVFGMAFVMGTETGLFAVCLTVIIAWIIVVAYLTYMLHRNTVVELDKGNYEVVKRWTMYGMIIGFLLGGGIITFALFLISYISIDDALRPKYPGYPPYPYYPPPPAYPYGPPAPPPQYPPQQAPPSVGIKGQPPVRAGYKIKQQPVSPAPQSREQSQDTTRKTAKYAVREKREGKPDDKD